MIANDDIKICQNVFTAFDFVKLSEILGVSSIDQCGRYEKCVIFFCLFVFG